MIRRVIIVIERLANNFSSWRKAFGWGRIAENISLRSVACAVVACLVLEKQGEMITRVIIVIERLANNKKAVNPANVVIVNVDFSSWRNRRM